MEVVEWVSRRRAARTINASEYRVGQLAARGEIRTRQLPGMPPQFAGEDCERLRVGAVAPDVEGTPDQFAEFRAWAAQAPGFLRLFKALGERHAGGGEGQASVLACVDAADPLLNASDDFILETLRQNEGIRSVVVPIARRLYAAVGEVAPQALEAAAGKLGLLGVVIGEFGPDSGQPSNATAVA